MIETGIVIAAFLITFVSARFLKQRTKEDVASPKSSIRLRKLWEYVDNSLKQNRFRGAERALLSILRLDYKNTAAYNRLGMLYAKQKNYEDAVECFEIASGLAPTIASLYNLGLVYMEQKNYKQAAISFERVIDLEPTAKRYIAYAKVHELLGNTKRVVDALEKAVAQEPTKQNLELLAQGYEKEHETEKLQATQEQIATLRAEEMLTKQVKQAETRKSHNTQQL